MSINCPNCSATLGPEDRFCGECGAQRAEGAPPAGSGVSQFENSTISSRYFSPHGRLSPWEFLKSYLKFLGVTFVVWIVLAIIDPNFANQPPGPPITTSLANASNSFGAVLFLLLVPVATWVSWCLTVKRFHDFDMGMEWPTVIVVAGFGSEFFTSEIAAYLGFVFSIAIIAVLYTIRGNPKQNEYGPPPSTT